MQFASESGSLAVEILIDVGEVENWLEDELVVLCIQFRVSDV